MNSKSFLFAKIFLIVLLVILGMMVFSASSRKAAIVEQPLPTSSVLLYNPPKEIKYDSSTDLKQELENINPQVSDSDFE